MTYRIRVRFKGVSSAFHTINHRTRTSQPLFEMPVPLFVKGRPFLQIQPGPAAAEAGPNVDQSKSQERNARIC